MRSIDWQNRPTFQQAVHFTAHRSGPTAGRAAGVPQTASHQLPRTGLDSALPIAATGLITAAGLVLLRRRTS